MKFSFLILFLTISGYCYAQKIELFYGYNTASFFDTTEFTRNRRPEIGSAKFYRKIPLIGLRYQYRGWKIGFEYTSYVCGYFKGNFWSVDSTMLQRVFSLKRMSIQKSFSFRKFSLSPQVAISYRYDGYKETFLFATQASGGWIESHFDYYIYRQYGFSTGIELSHPIFRGLHGLAGINYTRFSGHQDREMLMASYSLAFSFGCKLKKSQQIKSWIKGIPARVRAQ